jgi:lactoylglutathione lyase/glyoxylase I family protein
MIKAIAHICILTMDLEGTRRFYCDCLGLTNKFNFIRDGKVFGYYFQINEQNFIEVFLANTESSDRQPQIMHFCLEVDDIDQAIEKIRLYGVDVTDKALGPDNTYLAWLADPNGATIELHQYTDKSSQIVGGDCVIK